jgi:hypothetical protein
MSTSQTSPPAGPGPSLKPVATVVVGIHRSTAVSSHELFAQSNAAHPTQRPYSLAAVVDFVESPQPFQFSPHNLGMVLHATFPRPQARKF